jgi:tetratricopeptide (TPR) repeat protein
MPGYGSPYNNLGLIYYSRGEIDQAIALFQKNLRRSSGAENF